MTQLASKGFKVDCLHGDMKQTLRNKVIRGFKNKDFSILVATNVAARGIDISDLTHVINFAIPEEHESYIHRIGRTGRAGKQGIAIVFVAPEHVYRVKRLEKAANTSLQEIPIPPIEAIITAKMGAISDFVEQAKKTEHKLSRVHSTLKELINSFSDEEIKNALVMALEDKFFKDISHENLENFKAEPISIPQEICMQIGRYAGFSEEELVKMKSEMREHAKEMEVNVELLMEDFDRDKMHEHMIMVREEMQEGKEELQKALEELKVELNGMKMNEEAMKKLEKAMKELHEVEWTEHAKHLEVEMKNFT